MCPFVARDGVRNQFILHDADVLLYRGELVKVLGKLNTFKFLNCLLESRDPFFYIKIKTTKRH